MNRARLAVAVAAFTAAVLAAPAALFRTLDAFAVDRVEVGLDLIEQLGLPETPWPESDAVSTHIAFLGDSMVVSYPDGRRTPDRLQQRLDARSGEPGRIRVHSVAAPGMGPFDYYLLADLVAAAQPDVVILPFNLTSLADDWRGTFSRPELAGFIDPSRLPQALWLPLDSIGVTADRLFGYVALIQSGGFTRWRELSAQQARLGSAHTLVARKLGVWLAGNADKRFSRESLNYMKGRNVVAKTQRLTLEGAQGRFGKALGGVTPDEPSLDMLGAAIRVFRDHGIQVVVYTNPTNVDNLRAVGAANPQGLALTLASLEVVSRDAGARFVDLHDLLPDRGFRDFAGHLAFKGAAPDGPRLLARRLAPIVAGSVAD
ncbi:MAG: hypothetical protein VX466_13220 [Myxococcota bacterium]|nr:hypothetical protein [Myxococcota bacterium]